MGRSKIQIDNSALKQLLSENNTQKDIAKRINVSPATITKRIADLHLNEGPLLQFMNIKGLQLTNLQAKTLDCITQEKIDDTPLRELIKAYKIFSKAESPLQAKECRLTGLLGYLLQLGQEESSGQN